MITDLTAAALYDLVGVLKQHPDFLQKSEDEKATFPAVAGMLKDISTQDELLEALAGASAFLKGSESGVGNPLLQAMARFFTLDFPTLFDQLDKSFYYSTRADQEKTLNDMIPEKSAFYDALKNHLLVGSPQELTESIIEFLQNIYESPRLLVQSSTECDRATKTEIRGHFAQQYAQSIVQFSVNTQLIGGIRFFVDGQVDDHSWFGRIQDIKRLETLVS
ncbi:MAG: F0F1 ATP synthase subunit delta [Candidatus Gracilibacteria bacterium]|nr:F0F1 ATP synthase subunit delta [Candidatus Gracilibacteria bacterium]